MSWTLHGFGLQEWDEVLRLTSGLTCAWADTAGFHVGACPAAAPAATHLWAWDAAGETLVRARLDAGRAVVGVLAKHPHGDAVWSERVPVRCERARTWSPHEKRIADQPPGVLPGAVTTVTVLTPMPVTFVGPAGSS